ncbi:DUF3667 domain-containing protein [Massilia aurea]|uniref:DUF3667 domain-containing protein n=1 Tax=Massilia aurea TaxID=373040 RepID=UPI003461A82B
MTPDTLPQHASGVCKNCSAATSGNYCHQCGQAAHLHVPTAREFLHEFIAHYVALEGALWKSLGGLIFKPGFLTCEYIEGRRVRYLQPLRLYLTFSIIFFALFKFSGMAVINLGDDRPTAVVVVTEDDAAKARRMVAGTPEHAGEFKRSIAPIVSGVGSMNATLGQKVQHFLDLPRREQEAALKQAFFSYTPYAVFGLMPVFALYLRILYVRTGRRYGEHFLFGLHTNAFAFLMFSVLLLIPPSLDFLELPLSLWLMFYLPLAMHRVYGGLPLATGLRWIVLSLLHVLSLILAVVAAMALALMG